MLTQPETAIIIRTRNEERWIGEVLEMLQQQIYRDFEIVVVDSGSTDKTLEVVSKYSVKVIKIQPQEFTFPYAINLGIYNSNATKYLVILSAHSLPINKHWLSSGIDKFSIQKNVLGVYGPLKALPGSTIWDKLFHGISYFLTCLKIFPKSYRVIKCDGMGVLGFTNAIIRRDLWEKRSINEEFAGGGEDNDWAQYWLSRGYVAIKDLHFTVRHSHYLSLSGWIKQLKHWERNSTPKPFKYLSYRNDGSYNPIE